MWEQKSAGKNYNEIFPVCKEFKLQNQSPIADTYERRSDKRVLRAF